MKKQFSKLISLLTASEKRRLIRLLLGMVLVGIVEVVGITSILPFLTAVARPATVSEIPAFRAVYDFTGSSSVESFLFLLGIASLATVLLSNLASLLLLRAILGFSYNLNRNLAMRVLSGYLQQPYGFFLDRNSTKLMINTTGEIEGVVNGVLLPSLQAFTKIVAAALILTVVVAADLLLAIAFLAIFGGGYGLIYILTKGRVAGYGHEALSARRSLFSLSGEAFGSIKELKLSGRQSYYLDQFSLASRRYACNQIAYNLVAAAPRYLVEAIAFGSIIFVVLFLLKTGRDLQSAIPFLVLYAFTAYRLMPAVQSSFQNLATVQANWPSVELLSADAHLRTSNSHFVAAAKAMPFNRSIRLDHVSYTYPHASAPTLDLVDIEIQKNTAIGFVGETGAGKTTIVDIVLGLLQVTKGQILIDGVPMTDENLHTWQQNIGYVPQQIYLSDASIANNIAFGIAEEAMDMDKVVAAARAAQLHRFVAHELPEGYRTNVGERGVKLSGGQRQRIGIARALYDNPSVLVLDEATSALDGLTENAVVDAIRNLAHEKTILTVAHRIATVVDCDIIFVLERGRVIDQGSYSELISRSQKFRDLAKVA